MPNCLFVAVSFLGKKLPENSPMEMKSTEIRDLSTQELDKKLRDLGQELVNLRLRKQAGQVEDSSLLKSLRRDLAKFNTIRKEKELAS